MKSWRLGYSLDQVLRSILGLSGPVALEGDVPSHVLISHSERAWLTLRCNFRVSCYIVNYLSSIVEKQSSHHAQQYRGRTLTAK